MTIEEKMELFLEKNCPTDSAKWSASKAAAKAKFDEDVEKAKLRHNKAGETNRLTMNSIRLERSLLKSKHETELAFLDHRKELAAIDVDYDISLFSDDLQTKIENIDLEKKYKIEVARKVIKKEEEEEENHPKFTSRKENNRK